MASFVLLPHLHCHSHSLSCRSVSHKVLNPSFSLNTLKASIRGDTNDNATNGAIQSPKPSRRGRKKKPTSSPSSSSSTRTTTTTTTSTKRPRSSKRAKTQFQNGSVETKGAELNPETDDYDDGMDIPYEDPPLICCFGAVQKEFVPSVRVHDNQMHRDIYSQWKMLQWDPPEFGRAPGGPPSNVAISHARLGGRAAFLGKVGEDEFGEELVLMMNKEKVQTRGVKFDESVKTGCAFMKIKFDDNDGRMKMEMVKEAAEDSLLSSDLNLSVLKEVILYWYVKSLSILDYYLLIFSYLERMHICGVADISDTL